jgi:hypothetical protein
MVDVVSGEGVRVEQELDATRNRLGGHLHQLRDRMTPGQVLDDIVRYFRGREGADFGRGLLSSVKENPLPVAVTGVGLVWLMATNGRAAATDPSTSGAGDADQASVRRQEDIVAARARIRLAEQSVARQDGEPEQAYATRRDDARGYAIGVIRQADEKPESFAGRIASFFADSSSSISDHLQSAKDGFENAASAAVSTLSSYGSAAQTAVNDASDRAVGAVVGGSRSAGASGSKLATALLDSPVLMGALSLAAGAIIGALLPQSDKEETALGEVAEKVRRTATDLAQVGMDKGSQIANSVVDAGSKSVHTHGLAGERTIGNLVDAAIDGNMASDAKQVVEDVLEAGDMAVRDGLPGSREDQTRPKASLW